MVKPAALPGVLAKVGSASVELNGIPYARLCNPPRAVQCMG
jgi:hypothetical protein